MLNRVKRDLNSRKNDGVRGKTNIRSVCNTCAIRIIEHDRQRCLCALSEFGFDRISYVMHVILQFITVV
jgi:hypothetical protein